MAYVPEKLIAESRAFPKVALQATLCSCNDVAVMPVFSPILFSVLEGVSTWKTVIGRATFSGSAAEASLSLAGALVAGAASTTP